MVEIMLNTICLEPNRGLHDSNSACEISDLFPKIKEAGFNSLELWQYHISGKDTTELLDFKQKADMNGISLKVLGAYPTLHLDGKDGELETKHLIELTDKASMLGIPLIKFFLGKIKGSEISDKQLANTANNLRTWSETAKKHGIKLCAELHNNTLFDPVEAGECFLHKHAKLETGVCFQPYDFANTEEAVKLAKMFSGRIFHAHIQARNANGKLVSLENSPLDYSKVLPIIKDENPDADFSIEFVKDCQVKPEEFDIDHVLQNASQDLNFARKILNI